MSNGKTYVVGWKIDNIDGKVVDEGDEVQLTDEAAAPLVKLGALTLKPKPAKEEPAK